MYRNVAEATVEDPLEALLDLAESARGRLRQFAFVTAYGLLGGLVAAAILLPMAAVGVLLRGADLLYLLAGVAGVMSLVLVVTAQRVDRFLSYFDRRLRAIEGFVRFDPRPPVPEGEGAADRAVAWLATADDRFRTVLSRAPDRLARTAQPLGAEFPPVPAYFLRKSMSVPLQYHLLVFVLEKRAELEDLRRLKDLAERVAAKTGVPTDRVLVVQTTPAEIPEEVERWLDANWILTPRGRGLGGGARACPLQLLVEREDGRYEIAPAFAG